MASTIVLITGANSGIGFATSKVLVCASDAFHVIIASRSHDKAKAAKTEIEAIGIKGALSTIQLDVTNESSIKEAVAYVQQQFGRLDVLINNAGVGGQDSDVGTRFRNCMETNVIGPAVVSAAFRPLLLESENAYSIFVSSGARTLLRNAYPKPPSHANIPFGDAYPVSKAALNMLAVLEAGLHPPKEGEKGIKVFALSPGFVRSNLRGPGGGAISGWGGAGDPGMSGEIVLSIVRGERDADVGRLVHKDGIYPW